MFSKDGQCFINLVRTKLDLRLLPSFHLYLLCTKVTLTPKGNGNWILYENGTGKYMVFQEKVITYHTETQLLF